MPANIIALETRLVGGHWLLTYFASFLPLGLPGAYASQSNQLGRLGLTSFILLFFSTFFYAISGEYGFNAPVLARQVPDMLDAIYAYPPLIAMDALFVLCLLAGITLLGISS